jgi:hypothetical protein
MKIRIVIESVAFTVEMVSDEATQATEPADELDEEQTTLNGWVSTGRDPRTEDTPDGKEWTLRRPNKGKRSDFKKSHFSSCCQAEGRRALKRLGGYCHDCVPEDWRWWKA